MTAFYINSWRFHAGWVLWAVWFYCLCSTEEATGSLLSVVQDRISGHRVKNWFSSVLSTDYLCRVNQLTGHTLEVNNQKGGRGAFYVTEDLVLVGHEWGGPDPWGVMWSEVKAWMRTSHSFRRSSDPEQIGHKLCAFLWGWKQTSGNSAGEQEAGMQSFWSDPETSFWCDSDRRRTISL